MKPPDLELDVIEECSRLLRELEPDARRRVIEYLWSKFVLSVIQLPIIKEREKA